MPFLWASSFVTTKPASLLNKHQLIPLKLPGMRQLFYLHDTKHESFTHLSFSGKRYVEEMKRDEQLWAASVPLLRLIRFDVLRKNFYSTQTVHKGISPTGGIVTLRNPAVCEVAVLLANTRQKYSLSRCKSFCQAHCCPDCPLTCSDFGVLQHPCSIPKYICLFTDFINLWCSWRNPDSSPTTKAGFTSHVLRDGTQFDLQWACTQKFFSTGQ